MSGWAARSREDKEMNCQEFQQVLPHIIETGGNAEQEAHLQSCQACSELVRDLKYIAEQAKLLLPMRDPSPRVWSNIQQSLEREGLSQEGRMSRQGHITKTSTAQKKSWTPLGIVIAAIAVLALTVLLIRYQPNPNQQAAALPTTSDGPAALDSNDQVLVSQISQRDPAVARAYESSLKEVNSYISDSQQALKNDPGNTLVRRHLIHAYHQKAMLYEMATNRSLQ
jgi:hypothetical protein